MRESERHPQRLTAMFAIGAKPNSGTRFAGIPEDVLQLLVGNKRASEHQHRGQQQQQHQRASWAEARFPLSRLSSASGSHYDTLHKGGVFDDIPLP